MNNINKSLLAVLMISLFSLTALASVGALLNRNQSVLGLNTGTTLVPKYPIPIPTTKISPIYSTNNVPCDEINRLQKQYCGANPTTPQPLPTTKSASCYCPTGCNYQNCYWSEIDQPNHKLCPNYYCDQKQPTSTPKPLPTITSQLSVKNISCLTNNNLSILINGFVTVSNGYKDNGYWVQILDRRSGVSVIRSWINASGVSNINDKFSDFIPDIRDRGSLPLMGDGRTFVYRVYEGQYTTSIPQLTKLLAEVEFSKVCKNTPTPTPTLTPTKEPIPSPKPGIPASSFNYPLYPYGPYTPKAKGTAEGKVYQNSNGYWDFYVTGSFTNLLPSRNYQLWLCSKTGCSSHSNAKFTSDSNGNGNIYALITTNQGRAPVIKIAVWEMPSAGPIPTDPEACFMISNDSIPCLSQSVIF